MEWCSNHSNSLGIADHMVFSWKTYVAERVARLGAQDDLCWMLPDACLSRGMHPKNKFHFLRAGMGWAHWSVIKGMLVSSSLNMPYLFRSKGCLSTEWEMFNLVVRVRQAWETDRQWSACTQVLSILDVAVRFDVSPLVQFAVLWLVEFWQILGQWEYTVLLYCNKRLFRHLPAFWYTFGVGILPRGPEFRLVDYGSSFFTPVYAQDGFHSGDFFGLHFSDPCVFMNWAAIGTHSDSNSIEDYRNIHMHTRFLVISHGKTMENCCKSQPRIMRTSHSSNTFHSRCSSSKTTLLRNMLVECWRHGGLGSEGGKELKINSGVWTVDAGVVALKSTALLG